MSVLREIVRLCKNLSSDFSVSNYLRFFSSPKIHAFIQSFLSSQFLTRNNSCFFYQYFTPENENIPLIPKSIWIPQEGIFCCRDANMWRRLLKSRLSWSLLWMKWWRDGRRSIGEKWTDSETKCTDWESVVVSSCNFNYQLLISAQS